MAKVSVKGIFEVLKKAGSGFADDKILKLSAALAYYTIFSLAPLFLILLFFGAFFFGKEAVEGTVYTQAAGFIGKASAEQLQIMIESAAVDSSQSTFAIIAGLVTLLVGATTVFSEIQDSINQIWGLRPKPGRGIINFIMTRLLSFGVIASLGFLLLVSLGISTVMDALNDKLVQRFPDIAVMVFYILNLVLTFAITTIIFTVIFKVLPDANVRLKDVFSGAVATAILFMLGKFGISFYIGKADVGKTYGAAGSLVVLLVWIYYSAAILYFGAEFTKAYSVKYGRVIKPNSYAVTIRDVTIEEGNKSVQQVEKKKEKEEKSS